MVKVGFFFIGGFIATSSKGFRYISLVIFKKGLIATGYICLRKCLRSSTQLDFEEDSEISCSVGIEFLKNYVISFSI